MSAYYLPHQAVPYETSAGPTAAQYQTFANQQQPTFAFKKRFDRIDWKRIASTDVDSISRNLDFQALQDNIMNIAFCNIEAEIDIRLVDPNFVKLFKLAQLTIEYLLHSQDYMSSLVGNLESKLGTSQREQEELKRKIEKLTKELSDVKKECHKRKKMVVAQQQMIRMGTNAYNKCPYCSKAFVQVTYLQSHLARRHPERTDQYNSMVVGGQISKQYQQEAEIVPQQASVQQQLSASQQQQREESARLEAMERTRQEADERWRRELEDVKRRLELTEGELVEERNARNTVSHHDRDEFEQRLMEQEKKHQDRYKKQDRDRDIAVNKVTEMLMKEIRELTTKLNAADSKMAANQRSSRLGNLEDDDAEYEREQLRKQREEYAKKMQEIEDKTKRLTGKQTGSNSNNSTTRLVAGIKKVQNIDQVVEERVSSAISKPDDSTAVQAFDEEDGSDVESQQQEIHEEYTKQLEEQESTGAGQKKHVTMQEMDDDEESDEETEDLDGTSTLHSTGGQTLRTIGTTGSLSLSGTRNVLLMEQLKKNPHILQNMRKELEGLLDERLDQRGIPRGTEGISNKVLENKLAILQTERQGIANKYPLFYDIRQDFNEEADKLALKKLQELKRSQGPPPSSPQTKRASTPQGQQQRAGSAPVMSPGPNVNAPLPATATSTPIKRQQPQQQQQLRHQPRPQSTPTGVSQSKSPKAQRPRSSPDSPTLARSAAPRPAPRSGSPDKLRSSAQSAATSTNVSTNLSTNLSTTGRSYTTGGSTEYSQSAYTATYTHTSTGSGRTGTGSGTYTSTGSWTDGSEEEDDDEDEEDYTETVPTPTPRQGKGKSPQQLLKQQQEQDEESDGQWSEDISELDIMDPVSVGNKGSGRMPPSPAQQQPAHGTGRVAQLRDTVQRQLSERGGKKPAGGVNTLHREESESDSLGSLTGDETPRPRPSQRKTPTRGSIQTESDNTYGTSVWESGRGAKSRASKASTVASSGEDWDSPTEH